MRFNLKKVLAVAILLLLALPILVTGKNNAAVSVPTTSKTDDGTKIERNQSKTITLEADGNIQAALDSLEDDGQLILSEGVYLIDSPIQLNARKQLLIKGQGRVSIIGSRVDFPIFYLENCCDIIFQNLHAVHDINNVTGNEQFEKPNGSVIYLKYCENMVFNDCELEGCGVYGIYAIDTNVIDVIGCYLHHNSWRAFGIVNQKTKTILTIKSSNISQNNGFIESSENSCVVNLQGDNFISDNTPDGYKSSRR